MRYPPIIKKHKVLIVDDHKLFCEGLHQLLKLQDHLQTVGIAHDVRGAITAAQREKPDIVFLDIEMPGGDGFEALQMLKEILPDVIIIMLTMHKKEEYLIRALEGGACGYVLKDASLRELFDIIDFSIKGESRLEYSTIRDILRDFTRRNETSVPSMNDRLTKREKEILLLLSTKAYSNKQLALSLGISQNTIKNHISNIYEKLNCHNKIEAILSARQLKII